MRTHKSSQAGFSLVELMIVQALSAMLLFGVFQIFDANKRSSRLQHAYAEVQEAGRIAAELLSRDIRMADYWGCAPDIESISDNVDPAVNYDADHMDIVGQDGLSGENDVGSGKSIGGIAVKEGTDIIIIRGANNLSGTKVVSPFMPNTSAVIKVNTNQPIADGTIVIISDCTGGDRFVTTQPVDTGSQNIQHNSGDNGSHPQNKSPGSISKTYNGSAQILIPYKRQYFIGQNPDGDWSLYWESDGAVEELVRNVDDLQFVYGADSNSDGSADTFGEVGVISDMDAVISVRATFNAFSSDKIVAGESLNRVYSITANIRNRSL